MQYAVFLDELCEIYHDANNKREEVAAATVGDAVNEMVNGFKTS